MAAISGSTPLTRLRTWRATRRKSATDFLALGAATVAVFVLLLFGFDAMGGSGLMARMFSGTLSARTRADYSVTLDPRIKPLRPNGSSSTSASDSSRR